MERLTGCSLRVTFFSFLSSVARAASTNFSGKSCFWW